MVLEEEKERKVECWLKRKHVNVEEIAGFTFMQYYKPRPSKCRPYWRCLDGLGVFIFTLKSGFVRGAQLQGMWLNRGSRLNPAWIVQYLLARQIPFTNYEPLLRQLDSLAVVHVYNEFPKCMRSRRRWGIFELLFGSFVFFWSCLVIFGTPHVWLAGLLVLLIGIGHVGLSLFTLYQGISCQYALTLEPREMVLQRPDEDEPVKFAYSDLRKVNFTSAPFVSHEFISFIEFLDTDFAYHCYPIERVPVKKFDEIVSILRQLGIDATNSFK